MNHEVNTLGGKAIGAGGFGCVFYPSLKCENDTKRDKTKVSKLLSIKHAEQEYNEIKLIKPYLQKIPNYSNFFIIDDVTLCKPSELTEYDLNGFNNRCKNVTNYQSDTINDNLNKFKIVTMPYGGISIEHFINHSLEIKEKYNFLKIFVELHESMISLLLDAIIPMNRLNVYHSDIKADNILIDLNDSQLKIIDWGLSTIYCSYNFVSMFDGLAPFNSRFSFPKKWRDRSLSFNVPFSNIMFSDWFEDELSVFMRETPRNKTLLNCKIFIEIFLENLLKQRIGHSLYIERICSIVFDKKIGYKSVIINYNSKILHKYITSNTNPLGLLKYANTVYKQNIDVWGFVMAYAPILQGYHINKKNLDPELRRVFNKLKKIFITHLYRTHINPINVESLVNDLQEINSILYKKIEAPIKKEPSNKKTTTSKTKKTTTSKTKKTTTLKTKKITTSKPKKNNNVETQKNNNVENK